MKSEIFSNAIRCRRKLRFLYGLDEIIIEPYYISRDRHGKKVLFGRKNNSSEVSIFEYAKIFNIRVLGTTRFSPIIPILPIAS